MTNKFPQLFFFPLSVDDIYKDEPARRHKSVWLWMNLKKRGGPETWNDNDVFDFTGWAELGRQNWNSISMPMPTYSSLHGFTRPCNIIARVYDIITSTYDIWVTQKNYYYHHYVSITNWNIVVLLSTHSRPCRLWWFANFVTNMWDFLWGRFPEFANPVLQVRSTQRMMMNRLIIKANHRIFSWFCLLLASFLQRCCRRLTCQS